MLQNRLKSATDYDADRADIKDCLWSLALVAILGFAFLLF